MSMPDWIIGDVHGRWEVVHAAEKLPGTVLFLGDYLDSFTRPATMQARCLETIIQHAKQGRWRFLLGNHEHSYLYQDMRCAGWNRLTEACMMPLRADLQRYGQRFHYDPDTQTLCTHAGLTWWIHEVLQQARGNEAPLEQALQAWVRDVTGPFYWIGQARGGLYPAGGPLWCDLREFRSVPGLRQVFAHTPRRAGQGIWSTEDHMNFELDVLATDKQILHYLPGTNSFEIAELSIRRKSTVLS